MEGCAGEDGRGNGNWRGEGVDDVHPVELEHRGFRVNIRRAGDCARPGAWVVHWVVLFDTFTPTALEHTRTETVVVEAPASPMLAMARLEIAVAPGAAAWAGDEVPWIEYSIALRAAEFRAVATRKKNPKSTA